MFLIVLDCVTGNLKTSICWDARQKQLTLSMRQFVESERKLELKYKVRKHEALVLFTRSNIYYMSACMGVGRCLACACMHVLLEYKVRKHKALAFCTRSDPGCMSACMRLTRCLWACACMHVQLKYRVHKCKALALCTRPDPDRIYACMGMDWWLAWACILCA